MGLAASVDKITDRTQAGITLIEVLVTLFVISLATGAIIMSLPQSAPPLEQAERRVERFITDVFENAQLRGESFSIAINDDRLVLIKKGDDDWRTLDTQTLPDGVTGFQEYNRDVAEPARESIDAAIGLHLNVFPVGFMDAGVWVLTHRGEDMSFEISSDGSVTPVVDAFGGFR